MRRRLRIVEQIIIVLIFAVIVPLVVSTLIIANVNQQAIRRELQSSVQINTLNSYQYIQNNLESKKNLLIRIAGFLDYLPTQTKKKQFIKSIIDEDPSIKSLKLHHSHLEDTEFNPSVSYDNKQKLIRITYKINDKKYIEEIIDTEKFRQDVLEHFNDKERRLYVFDEDNDLVFASIYNDELTKQLLEMMPSKIENDEPQFFFEIKNQPNMVIQTQNPNWKVVVTTPVKVTKYGIKEARYKIIVATLAAAAAIIVICLTYMISLYTNLRQLFKAIKAVSEGNYDRRIRLIVNYMTPYEVMFLAHEFNKMVDKIRHSYKEINDKNERLKQLDSFKSNLIDTVSHEFRTPLTSIKGYTSRLLRNDVTITEDMRIKSLKTIKRQTERLSRMVEDLLVIPDIETSVLRVFPENINIASIIDNVALFMRHNTGRVINIFMPEECPLVYADEDRVEQIIINLLENAAKYAIPDTEINVHISSDSQFAKVVIQNECQQIEEEKLNKLFDKFTRMDDSTTRTTRGTGLGLFIVKGLVEAMGGKIMLSSHNDFSVTFTLPLADNDE
ncbi:MAG TPA: GHKL domain-containing protein [Candidatus Adamsella sp.]|nr:GHKL domain-containing protein [Candidatus Adamsella sp.]